MAAIALRESSMKESYGYVLSIALHVGIVAIAYTGIPFLHRELPHETPPLIVDLVPIEEITAAPPPVAPPTPDPVPLTPPEPPKPVQAEAPAEAMPPPKKEEVVKKEEKKPEIKPPPKPVPPQKTKKEDVAMLQDLLKDMQKKAPKPTPSQQQSQTQSNNITPNVSDRASMTELDAIRRHIEDCWRIDPGKEGLENMSADIKVYINPDGSVQQAQIVDTGRYLTDSAFRTFATSARNAVLGCGNIPISPQRYNLFKEITMTFSPQGRIN